MLLIQNRIVTKKNNNLIYLEHELVLLSENTNTMYFGTYNMVQCCILRINTNNILRISSVQITFYFVKNTNYT